MAKVRLLRYAVVHFLVDLGCTLLVLGRICPQSNSAMVILLYNFFAFAVQMPMGLVADKIGRCRYFAAAGCLLVLAGWLLPAGVPAAMTAGLGNAAFHVGGGLNTLNESGDKAGPLGLFVSTGAFGVYFGGQWALNGYDPYICLLLGISALVLLPAGGKTENAGLELPGGNEGLIPAILCLLAVVILRSLLGLAADLPWKTEHGILAVSAVAGGKAAGGYLADRFGTMRVAMASLGLAAVCFFAGKHILFGVPALFLFNMTMPLTLWAVARLMPGIKGFSFGLLTFGLFLGFLPVFYGMSGLTTVCLGIGTVISIPILYCGLRKAGKGNTNGIS